MFVHREEYYQTTDEDRERVKGEAEIIVQNNEMDLLVISNSCGNTTTHDL